MPTVQVTGFDNINASLRQIIVAINNLNDTLDSSFPEPLTSSATWNPASVADKSSTTTTIAVTGAVLGNAVSASFSLSLAGLQLTGYVSAADTVTVVLSNLTGGAVDLASGTLKVRVYN